MRNKELRNPAAQGPLKYAPAPLRLEAALDEVRTLPALPPPAPPTAWDEEEPKDERTHLVNLEQLEEALAAEKDRLKELAVLAHSLTYGEMIEFVSAIAADTPSHDLAGRIAKWAKDNVNGTSPVEEEASSPVTQ